MSPSNLSSPRELLLSWLGSKPKQTRCEWVIDTDRLVDWRNAMVMDTNGRAWHQVLYTGDDISFRWSYRKAFRDAHDANEPLLIVVTRGSENTEAISACHITDILAQAESDPLDLSIVSFFKSIFPRVNPPQDALKRHKTIFLENIAGLRRAYGEIKNRWGEPDNWGRDQLVAVILLARYPELRLHDVYREETDLTAFLAHVCRLVMYPTIRESDYDLVWQTVRESAHVPLDEVGAWLDLNPADLAAYLIMRDFAEGQGLQNPAVQLMGKFSFRLAPEAIESHAPAVIEMLRRDSIAWERVNLCAATFLKERSFGKVLELIDRRPETLVRVALDEKTSPVLMRDVVAEILRTFFDNPQRVNLAWTEGLEGHNLLTASDRSSAHIEGASLLECLMCIYRVESRIAISMPHFNTPEELLDWYCDNGMHLLELDIANAYHCLEQVEDPELLKQGDNYLLRATNSLKRRTRDFLDQIDQRLAGFIRPAPRRFAYGPRSALRIIAETIGSYRPGAREGRVWILIFDGMRFDTWDQEVWPLLKEYFQVIDGHEGVYFAALPSKTAEARRALLAGALADKWLTSKSKPTRDERVLAGKGLGLTSQDVKDVRFITDAQTSDARRKMGFKDSDAAPFNVLIYPISDNLGHSHNDTLTTINSRIRRDMLGDMDSNLRGILDDLLRRVSPSDVVLVTSDHGFIELLPDQSVGFTSAELRTAGQILEETVQYRYLRNYDRSHLQSVVRVQWDKDTKYVLPVGGLWFRREQGRPARYAHGGVSMAEMIVPGVFLRRITEKEARVEYVSLPEKIQVSEDETLQITFALSNVGNVDVDFELTGVTNLGDRVLLEKGRLPVGKKYKVQAELVGRYAEDASREVVPEKTTKSLTLALMHSYVDGRMQEPPNGRVVIPVTVEPKATKIETDALKGFDDL